MDTVQAPSKSLSRPISPPPSRRRRSATPEVSTPRALAQVQAQAQAQAQTTPPLRAPATATSRAAINQGYGESATYIPSPVQLTRIRDLPASHNVDAVGLEDVLGDPLIRECWNFNFLFDLDFVMSKFDPDVRDLVKTKIVHGFWRREDEQRIRMMETAERFPNLELISAYIPNPFGTHHSKMLILLRHDDTAQVIIHTANMITRDWQNMTQAVWRSPLLPLHSLTTNPFGSPLAGQTEPLKHPIGSGERFKVDLFHYLNAYEKKLRGLTEQLIAYDFSAIRAAFIGSAPSRQKPSEADSSTQTSFGWLGVREILSAIPISSSDDSSSPPNIVIQTSSIATLGPTPTWLTHLQSVLSCSSASSSIATASTATNSKSSEFFAKRKPTTPKPKKTPPTLMIIFPTADEIRMSLDGYGSGFSIHTKLQSPAQQKQLEYLRPLLYHWRTSNQDEKEREANPRREAHRGLAAPHIKTYIRFSSAEQKTIDWAMMTSANLSKQAWGEAEYKKGEIWIQSWECGVVVWPDLFRTSADDSVTMVPVFGKDTPGAESVKEDVGVKWKVIGFRMPYDLQPEPYGEKEVPWCATAAHEKLDWKGQAWSGYQPQ